MSAKKLGRVMWLCPSTHVLHDKPGQTPVTNEVFIRVHVINLSDPAALVEAVAKAAWEAGGFGYSWTRSHAQDQFRQEAVGVLRALGVPAKLLKERKGK